MEQPSFRRVAWDTSAAIYYLSGIAPYSKWLADQLEAIRQAGGTLMLSAVAYHELLVGPLTKRNPRDLARVVQFCRTPPTSVVPLTASVARRSAMLRAATRLATPDALIIGTAQAADCSEIVGNDSEWRRVPLGIRYRYLRETTRGET